MSSTHFVRDTKDKMDGEKDKESNKRNSSLKSTTGSNK